MLESSSGVARDLLTVLVAFRQSDHSSASAPQVQSTCSKTLSTRAETSPSRGRRRNTTEVPCWRAPLELLGTAPDVSGDCSPLDTLLGSGTNLVEFPRFAFLRCLMSLPFRADGIDILDFLASGVLADFRQPSRSAFQPQVRSTSRNTSLSPLEALR